MSMSQAEWAARVAAIGKMAGIDDDCMKTMPTDQWQALVWLAIGEEDPATVAALKRLLADWLAAEGVVAVRACRWKYDEHHEKWDGTCGVAWCMIDGGLAENHVNYCPRCGGKIEVEA